jgi:hypothetical protein
MNKIKIRIIIEIINKYMKIQGKIKIGIIKQVKIIFFRINTQININNIQLNKTFKMNLLNYSQFKENVQLKDKLILFLILKSIWARIFSSMIIKLWKVIFRKISKTPKNIIKKGNLLIYIQNKKNKK